MLSSAKSYSLRSSPLSALRCGPNDVCEMDDDRKRRLEAALRAVEAVGNETLARSIRAALEGRPLSADESAPPWGGTG